MKQTMTTSQIADELRRDESAGWSYAGARALAEFLESVEEDTGEEMVFDRVAIRCDFSEYSSALEAAEEYGFEPGGEDGETEEEAAEANEAAALAWLYDQTSVIEFDGGVIIRQF